MDTFEEGTVFGKRNSKLMPRSDGPFEILEKIRPNAYKVDLPGEYCVSTTFNVANLSRYHEESEEIPSLRSNSHQAGRMMEISLPRILKGWRTSRKARKKPRMPRGFRPWSETSYVRPTTHCPVHLKITRFLCIW